MVNGFVIGFLMGILIVIMIALVFVMREINALNMQKELNIIIGDKLVDKCVWIENEIKNGRMNADQAKLEHAHIKTLSVIWDEIMNIPCEQIAISFKKITPENFLNEEQMNLIINEI